MIVSYKWLIIVSRSIAWNEKKPMRRCAPCVTSPHLTLFFCWVCHFHSCILKEFLNFCLVKSSSVFMIYSKFLIRSWKRLNCCTRPYTRWSSRSNQFNISWRSNYYLRWIWSTRLQLRWNGFYYEIIAIRCRENWFVSTIIYIW